MLAGKIIDSKKCGSNIHQKFIPKLKIKYLSNIFAMVSYKDLRLFWKFLELSDTPFPRLKDAIYKIMWHFATLSKREFEFVETSNIKGG
jgi:hypothetical protein